MIEMITLETLGAIASILGFILTILVMVQSREKK